MSSSSFYPIIIASCVTAATVVGMRFNILKRMKELLKNKGSKSLSIYSELSNLRWMEVGEVTELNIFPISSGKGLSSHSVQFTEHGINVKNNGITLTDGMFLVLDVMSRKLQSSKEYKNLSNISVNVMNNQSIRFSAPDMPDLIFRLDQKTNKIFSGEVWHDNSQIMECIDCGEAASKWINCFLQTANLRVVRPNYTSITNHTNAVAEYWSRYVLAYTNVKERHSTPFANLTRYVLITKRTFDELDKAEMPFYVFPTHHCSNIVVSTPLFHPFAERNWHWIKIGNTILRQVKPVPRYMPVYIRNKSNQRPVAHCMSPNSGIYCGLYVTGEVKIGDKIYIHVPEDMEITKLY